AVLVHDSHRFEHFRPSSPVPNVDSVLTGSSQMRAGHVAIATGILLCVAGCGRQVAMLPAPRPSAGKPAATNPQRVKAKPALPASPASPPRPTIVAAKPTKPAAKAPAKSSPSAAATPATKGKLKPVPVDSVKLEQDLIDQWEHAPLAYVLSRR